MIESSHSIAAVPVTADQLHDAVSALKVVPPEDADTLEGCIKAIIEVLVEDGIEDQQQLVDTGSAICARLMAFAALLKAAPASPWLASQSAQTTAGFQRPLLEAMAMAPLQVEQGQYQFDPEGFFKIVLEKTPAAGSG